MAGIAKLEETLAKMEAALEEIREATREAHGVLRDLRATEKEVRDLLGPDVRSLAEEVVREEFARVNTELAAGLRTVINECADFVKVSSNRARSDPNVGRPAL